MLRAKFDGQPEHVINFLFMVAEECRELMASMGFATMHDMVGRADMLEADADVVAANPKLAGVRLPLMLPNCQTDRTHAMHMFHLQPLLSGPAFTKTVVSGGCTAPVHDCLSFLQRA